MANIKKAPGPLTDAEQDVLIGMMARIHLGKMRPDSFAAIASQFTMCPVEAIVLRKVDDKIQVLLRERPSGDPNWNKLLDTGGTVTRRTDYNLSGEEVRDLILRSPDDYQVDMFAPEIARLEETEFGGRSLNPIHIAEFKHVVLRGPEKADLFLCQLDDHEHPPEGWSWYDVKKLPENIVPTQPPMIDVVASIAEKRGLFN